MDITCVTIGSHEPAVVAAFRNEALGWGGVAVSPDGGGAVCGPPGGGTLDELEDEIERLVDLGATIAWEEEFDPAVAEHYRNLVLLDPEGNEFCLGGGQLGASPTSSSRLRSSQAWNTSAIDCGLYTSSS